ncbi:MAG: tetratricopeptide repeat protein, partial [Oscillospiraceae bacterium]
YAIIERYPNERDFCELQLRKLVPPTIYHRLLTELYPVLRRNEYRIEYNVRNFDLEEAKRQIETRPDLLSLSEMYKVAGAYGKGTPEYDKVMAVAVRYFPTSPAALNENALSAIAREEYDVAIELLEKSETAAQTAELLNTLGVAYAKAGQYDKAEDTFRRAAEAGSETARHNLEEVRQVMDQL